jgi:HPt (histidine-containing phosphotransfer) domain-containing protein
MKDISILKDNGIDIDASIELLGDIEMYDETLEDFLTESEDRLPKILEYKNNSDMDNYAILVHAMKGDSKYLGFTKLAELSYNHQLKSQDNDIKYVNEHFDELMDEANRVISIVCKYLGK